jgi:hypothetical protein
MRSAKVDVLSRIFEKFKKDRSIEKSASWKKVQAFFDIMMVIMWIVTGVYFVISGRTVDEMLSAVNAITVSAMILTTASVSLFNSVNIFITNDQLGVKTNDDRES